MVRWSEIIELVQSQIVKSGTDNDDLNDCMKKIMNMSMKNKERLELEPEQQEFNSSQSSSLYMETSIPQIGSRSKLKHIKADRVYLQDSLDKQEEFQEEQAFDIEQHF